MLRRSLQRVKKFESITPVLANLRWLPVHFRVKYKILIFVYKALNNQAPTYLTNLLIPYNPPKALRSENQKLLTVPRTKYLQKGNHAFAVMGPRLWNELPLSIRSTTPLSVFRNLLKAHLVLEAYNSYLLCGKCGVHDAMCTTSIKIVIY